MTPTIALIFSALLLTGCGGSIAANPGDDPGDPATAAAGTSASAHRPPADPNDVWLAFGAGSTDAAVYVMRADGLSRRRLDLGMEASAPAFSPDGRALAYASNGSIWVRDLRSQHSHQVTRGRLDGTPAWSPDGKLLAFTRDINIYVVAADGTGERSYINGPPPGQAWFSNYGHPVFSIDGQSLIFGHRGGIDRGNLDGSGVQPLFITSESDIAMVTVSPDGTQLAITSGCGLRAMPFASAARACELGTPLGGGYGMLSRPAWGANGLIAYADTSYRISVVSAAGGTPVNILDTKQSLGGVYVNEVSWSPPGTLIP